MTSPHQEEERTPEFDKKTLKEIQEREHFAYPPGSSQRPLDKYHSARRKIEMAEESLSARPDFLAAVTPSDVKIGLVTDRFPVRIRRRIYRSGAKRKPTNSWPTSWMYALGIDWENKDNANDEIIAELSADRKTITIKKAPMPPGMQKNVDYELFTADSDAAAELEEIKHQEK
jgi:hypothetical protein